MSLNEPLLLISPFIFGVLGVLSAIQFVRKPDRIRRDTALMLNSLAIALVLDTSAFGIPNETLAVVKNVLLLAHPFLLLRLVQQFSRPLPKWILRSSEIAWLICAFLLVIHVTTPLAAVFMVAYAVFYESAAVFALVRGTRASLGMMRLHLLLAAIGTGLLGVIALVIGFMPVLPANSTLIGAIIEMLLAGSAVSYYLAFATPRWLRSFWQSQALYAFLTATLHLSANARPTKIYEALADFSARFLGGTEVLVAAWDETTHELQSIHGAGAAFADLKFERGPLMTVIHERQAQQITQKSSLDAAHSLLLRQLQANILFAVPLTSKILPHGLLLIGTQVSPLFEEDELDLVTLIAQHAGLLLDDFAQRNQIIEEELRQRTKSIRLLQNIALSANEATSSEKAFQIILERICTAIGAQVGHIFVRLGDDPNTLVSSRAWYLEDIERFEAFRATTEQFQIIRGMGLVGRAMEAGRPEQIENSVLMRMYPARAAAAEQCGITSAFLCPILIKDEVAGILELYFVNTAQLTSEFRDMTRNIGVQLGRVLERERAKEALYQSEWWFRISFEQAAIGLAHISPDGNWLRVNQKLCEMLGYTREELLERTWQSLTHPDDLDTDQQQSTRLQMGDIDTYTLEKRFIRKDGKLLWVNLTNSLARHPSGDVAYGIKVVIDITARKLSEEALHKSDARVAAILRMAADAIITVDEERQIIVFNQGAETIFGYKADQVLGKPWTMLLAPAYIDFMKKLVAGRDEQFWKRQTTEVIALDRNGREFPADITLSRVEQGDQFIYTVILRDISERKQVEKVLAEERNLLRMVIDNIPVAVYVKDTKGRFLVVNPMLITNFGLSDARDVLGKTDFDLHPFEQAQVFFNDEQKLMETGEAIIEKDEMISTPVSGEQFVVSTKLPLFGADGEITGLIGMNYDVTERKRNLEQIQRLNLELEQRVAERTMHLEAANRELEAFTYTVSHDLRSPLRAIYGFSRYILDHFEGQLSGTLTHYVERIHANSETMGDLIDTLLMLSRLEHQQLSKRIVSPTELAQEALNTVLTENGTLMPTVTIAELPPAYADATLLRQVFVNLLSNAVKFSRNCEHAEIEVNAYRADDGIIVYYIKDNGVGFDMAFKDKLFGVFQRLHDDDEFEGNGAGLSIVKRIVTRHGGSIWAESEVNQGASFFFTLQS
ncbi:MAG: PAS domain S-box protein [Chloroflexi bacterium]|nr:PAS domain S-box protein [Chloroflexota bacterium]